MLTFLFWNTNDRPLGDTVVRLVRRYEVDVLMLAECRSFFAPLLLLLNEGAGTRFQLQAGSRKVVIYTRFSRRFLRHLGGGKRFDFYKVALPARTEMTLAVAHLPDKRNWSDESQAAEAEVLVRHLREIETSQGHGRTLLVGDLNMNPFVPAMVKANGLNAVPARSVAARGKRTLLARDYPFFYNPMWAHFGDRPGRPPGTFYYDKSEHVTYYWNIFDQVLLRPALLPLFKDEDVRVLSEDGEHSLLSARGRPDRSAGSDHLPLLFRLDI